MPNFFILGLVLVVVSASAKVAKEPPVTIAPLKGANELFVPHHGSKPFENWLGMQLPYAPVRDVLEQVERNLGKVLKNRGEAHITVVTPPEFDGVLKAHLTIQEIDEIAQSKKLQNAKLEAVCIGRGEAKIDGKAEQTYFIVLKSPGLLKIREAIRQKFVAKGGKPALFAASHFYPHITIGFTKTDLHEQQGVIKDSHSCWLPAKR